jgi:hypothetical protein
MQLSTGCPQIAKLLAKCCVIVIGWVFEGAPFRVAASNPRTTGMFRSRSAMVALLS